MYVGVLLICVNRTNFDVITCQTVKVPRDRISNPQSKDLLSTITILEESFAPGKTAGGQICEPSCPNL